MREVPVIWSAWWYTDEGPPLDAEAVTISSLAPSRSSKTEASLQVGFFPKASPSPPTHTLASLKSRHRLVCCVEKAGP